MCCGDGVCDGPETKATCPADCPLAPSSAAFGRVDEAVRSKAVPCRLALFDLETRDRTRLVWPSLQSTECDGNARRPTATLCGSAHRNDLARRP
jgi:hypothetical protein